MAMVFCRGCGKEIHEAASTCPHCGAPQGISSVSASPRSIGKRIGFSVIWTLVFWFVSLIIAGMTGSALDPQNPTAMATRANDAVAGMFFFLSLLLSGGLSIAGILPGTKKR